MQAQTQLIQRVEKPSVPADFTIPFTKYKLPNGLTLVVHEDHSDPIVHVDVTYHVGSAREEIGMSGFAHFFEHMMFQGSKHVGDEEHFKIINGAGGTMNGSTNRDRTNYFETVPKNYLETALWLEADRMGFLLEAVSQKKFEVQRATVKNEKGQRYENRPYGMVGEISSKSFYPFGHPYAWPTIGYIEDLNRVGVDELKKFFLRWYGPNNAVVTVGGDVKTEEVLKMVEKYFGSIPRGPEVYKATPESFTLGKEDRYISYEDNIRFPMLRMTFPSVPIYHPDEAALDILAEIMGQGKNSILYQNFIKTKKAVQASASNPTAELAGEFNFSILAFPDTKLSETEELLRKSIDEFITRGITDEDIEKAKAKREASAIYGLESVSGKVTMLAAYETFLGTPDFIREDVARFQNITKEDILRVYKTYIQNRKGLVLSVYPKGKKDLVSKADNFKPGGDSTKVSRAKLDLQVRPVKDDFNRAKRPKPAASPIVVMPPKFVATVEGPLSNMKIIGTTNREVPMAYIQFNVKCGQVMQPKGKEGIAYLLSRMMKESTMGYTAEKMEEELDKLGSNIDVWANEEDIVIGITSLTRNLEQTMHLASELILRPRFNEEEFNRLKKQQLEYIGNQSTQADAIANQTFSQLLYGKDNVLATSMYGTANSVESIGVNELRGFHNKHFTAANVRIIASGDIDAQRIQNLVTPFMSMRPMPASEIPAQANLPKIEKTKIYLVNKEGAPQSELRIGYLALPYDATGEYYKAGIMNYILGGAFNSRINLNLRENKGYTYGARSGFNGSHTPGPWRVSTGVRGDATDSAVAEILKEIKNYRENGITKEELTFTKNSILEREALKYETNSQKAGFLERILEYNLNDNYVTEQIIILKKLKRKDIKRLAEKYLPLETMAIVVVGDAKSVKPGLEKLGYEVVDMDMSSIGFKSK
ncbi:MAG: M16 family metallopeptidase [Bacteroidia bacterium]